MNRRLPYRARSLAAVAAVALAVVVVAQGAGASSSGYILTPLVSDGGVPAPNHDPTLVNAWGLAASPTGPWWTGNEARGTSTLYSSTGRKQQLTVSVPGGPTGVAYYGEVEHESFKDIERILERCQRRRRPARFGPAELALEFPRRVGQRDVGPADDETDVRPACARNLRESQRRGKLWRGRG